MNEKQNKVDGPRIESLGSLLSVGEGIRRRTQRYASGWTIYTLTFNPNVLLVQGRAAQISQAPADFAAAPTIVSPV
jgi:hypothetical protein